MGYTAVAHTLPWIALRSLDRDATSRVAEVSGSLTAYKADDTRLLRVPFTTWSYDLLVILACLRQMFQVCLQANSLYCGQPH